VGGAVEILHADFFHQVGLEGVVDIFTGFLFEDKAETVKIPVAVEEVFAMFLRISRRGVGEIVAAVGSLMVNAGAGA